MPIYEFRCGNCGNRFELLIRGESSINCCSKCGSSEIKRIMSVFGFNSGGKAMTSTSSSCGGCHSHNCGGCKH